MQIPDKMLGLKWLTVIVGLYGLVWITLEGAMRQVILMATGLTLLSGLYLMQYLLGGRTIRAYRWLVICAGLGGIAGLGCALLALALMAIKTGLHGHGPEFTADEIEWLVGQMPLWALSGALAGLGLGLLAMARQGR